MSKGNVNCCNDAYCFVFASHYFVFFFNDTATTEIYTLSLHDALPISPPSSQGLRRPSQPWTGRWRRDRKSTRLNSSHPSISYAVFCLKKKKLIYSSLYLFSQVISTNIFTLSVYKY